MSKWEFRWQYRPIDLRETALRYDEIAKDAKYPNYQGKAQTIRNAIEHFETDPIYPFYIVYDDDHHEMDRFEDIAYYAFGPAHGECSKEYTEGTSGYCNEHFCCPGVEIQEDFYLQMWEGYGKDNWWKSRYPTYEKFLEAVDEGPQTYDHSHIGDWKPKYLVKTGYDRGMTGFQFKTKEMLNDFIVKTTLGPQYESIGD